MAQLVEGLPGMHEDSIPSPAAQVGMDMPVIPAPGKRRQEDQKYKLTLGYTVSSRPAWFQSLREILSLKKKKEKNPQNTLSSREVTPRSTVNWRFSSPATSDFP